MATFVLVHGAWHGGWCWRKVAEPLRAKGHSVFAPSLTGLGDRVHLASPELNLDTHIADIVNLLEAEELSDVILCGHSYAGMVITGVAERAPQYLRGLVYLDAFVPASGQGLEDMLPTERREANLARVADEGAGWRIASPDPEFWKVRSPEDIAWLQRHLVDHPFASMTQPLLHSDPWLKFDNRTFVLATLNKESPFHPIVESFGEASGWRIETVDCGHDVMVDEPEWLIQLLESTVKT
ncbi:MAG: alpha/beta hydrolase [Proteobacteria bacterium]|nr:alpha/beta hydrolase [Pseudomonadota bacterium]